MLREISAQEAENEASYDSRFSRKLHGAAKVEIEVLRDGYREDEIGFTEKSIERSEQRATTD